MAQEAERLFITLFLDENVDEKLAPVLRNFGFEVQTAREAGRRQLSDEEQLEHAAQHGMAILSHNIADFARLHQRWQGKGKEHWGIILTSETEFRALLRRVLSALDRFTADEIRNRIVFI